MKNKKIKMGNFKAKMKNLKNADVTGTFEQALSSIKNINPLKLIIFGVILIALPLVLEVLIIVLFIAYHTLHNLVLCDDETILNKDTFFIPLESIKDLVIVTSEKVNNTGYSVTINPRHWNSNLGKVDTIKIIFEETELGERLHAYVTYKEGDKNKIILPKKAYFLESELKSLILL